MNDKPASATTGPDYHDYVFKDGKMVGRFQEMYRDIPNPWPQQQDVDALRYRIIRTYLEDKGVQTILDVGCGFGFFTENLRPLGRVIGFDIAPAAVIKGKKLHPRLHLMAADVRDALPLGQKVDTVIALQLFWYVIDRIDQVLDNLAETLKPGGYFITSLYIPDDPVGKEVISNAQDLINIVKSRFRIDDVIEYYHFQEEAQESMDMNRLHRNVYIFASSKMRK
jgi:SAM-dependent methyltransferase